MKKIGILGGLGPESTLYYYRGIIDAFKTDYPKTGYPEMVIESMDLKQAMTWVENNRWDLWIAAIVARLETLGAAGADFGVIASNTPHKFFNEIQSRLKLKMISIVEETCRCVAETQCVKPALWGTRYTMESDFYQTQLVKRNIHAVVPNPKEQEMIQEKLFNEIELGIIRGQTKKELLAILQTMEQRDGIDSVILACTELPLILSADDTALTLFDTAHIHVDAVVRYCKA